CRIRPSCVRSKTEPQASSSRTRSGASFACSSAMRQLLTYWPPRMVSAKCTFQLSRSSTFASAAAMPPSAMTVWAFPRRDLQTIPPDTPAADASMAARRPAPPAPMTNTSCSCVSYCIALPGSENPPIPPDAHRTKSDVNVGKHDREKTQPGPQHVAAVQATHATVSFLAGRGSRGVIQKASDQMTQRVTTQRITAQQKYVHSKYQRADADPERPLSRRLIDKPHPFPDVMRQNANKHQAEVQKIPMDILENERK